MTSRAGIGSRNRAAAALGAAVVLGWLAGGCGDETPGSQVPAGSIRDAGTADAGFDAGNPSPAARLPLVVLLYREDEAAFLDQSLREDDIVATWCGHVQLLTLLEKASRLVSCPSIPEMETTLQAIAGTPLDYIAYNPESYKTHGTPQSELDDLPAAVASARQIADAAAAKLAFVPDGPLLSSDGARIAPLVDMFGIQVQRFQLETPGEFRTAVETGVATVRGVDPDVPVVIQLFMAPPVYGEDGKPVRDENGNKVYRAVPAEDVIASMESIADLVQGVAIDYDEATVGEMKRLVEMLR